jgi:hypothetical protein
LVHVIAVIEAERAISLVVGKSFPVGSEGVSVATFPITKRRRSARFQHSLHARRLLE